jgi:hypothetical protein
MLTRAREGKCVARYSSIHIAPFFSKSMFELLLTVLLVQQVLPANEQMIPLSKHPLFAKIFRLLDQLLFQVRRTRILLSRTYDVIDHIPDEFRQTFSECTPDKYNVIRMQYSLHLSEAEITRIPQIQTELKQATTVEQQMTLMNRTDRVVADITLNVVKPSLSLLTGILDCLARKFDLAVTK